MLQKVLLTIIFLIAVPALAHSKTDLVGITSAFKSIHEGISPGHALDTPIIQISFINKYNTPKYDRKVRNRYNTKENKHTRKYDKSKHDTYNGGQSKKRIKYVKNKHNKYNEKENKYTFKKHIKKFTKKYYNKYNKRHSM